MQAALLAEPGRIEIRDIPAPEPSRGEVVVKIKTALTCGTDLKAFLRGHPMIPMPGSFGHEFSGVISDAGKGVRGFREGDEIMAVHSAPCLKCVYCKKKLYNLCEDIMRTKALGAFAEYMLLPAHLVRQNLFHKPKSLSFEEAAFLEPLSCVVHSVTGLNFKKGHRILIIGAGPIGLLHLLLVKRNGAKAIIAGLEQERLNLAEALGADKAVLPSDMEQAVEEFTDGTGVDLVFECTGQPEVWEGAVNYVRRGGAVILFGGCKKGAKAEYDTYRIHYDEITLSGVFHFTPDNVKAAYKFLKILNVSPLISGTYPLKDINKAFGRLSKGDGIKYAIKP